MAGDQRHGGRTEDTDRVNAMVLVETAVFRGNKRMHQLRWDLVKFQRNTTFFTVLSDQVAVSTINLHRCLQAHVFKRGDVRELWLDIFIQAEYRGCSQQNATHCKNQKILYELHLRFPI